jgi:linoleoyl-CoA desaturase
MLALPLWLLPDAGVGWGVVLGAYAAGQMLASCVLVSLILGTHWSEVEFFQPGADGAMPHTWYEHSFRTACDWSPRPAWLGHLLGGLDKHLTHHLFPTWSHRHYPALAAIVARLAPGHRLRYRDLSYPALLAAQQGFLKSMGKRPAPLEND